MKLKDIVSGIYLGAASSLVGCIDKDISNNPSIYGEVMGEGYNEGGNSYNFCLLVDGEAREFNGLYGSVEKFDSLINGGSLVTLSPETSTSLLSVGTKMVTYNLSEIDGKKMAGKPRVYEVINEIDSTN